MVQVYLTPSNSVMQPEFSVMNFQGFNHFKAFGQWRLSENIPTGLSSSSTFACSLHLIQSSQDWFASLFSGSLH